MKILGLEIRWKNNNRRVDTTPINKWLEVDNHGQFYHYINGILKSKGDKFSNDNAYKIANGLAEVFIPIDIISERVAGCDFFIRDKNTKERIDKEKLPENLKRLIEKPNPFQTPDALRYQIMFNELSTGGSFNYPVFATKTKRLEYISSIYCINTDNVSVKFKNEIPTNSFLITDYSELVSSYKINHFNTVKLNADDLIVNISTQLDFNTFMPTSPLNAVAKNINNLMVVYSARYNVFANNGSAGILVRERAQDGDMQQFDTDSEMRQKMVEELKSKDGIVGNKNFIGISGIAMKYIETLGKIKDLQPFEETIQDLLTIGAIYGVDKDLLPRKDGTTFSNKKDAEKHLWQNIIIPYSFDLCKLMDKLYYLSGTNYEFGVSHDDVEVLQEDRKLELEADILEVDKEEKLNAIGLTSKLNEKYEQV